MSLSPEHLSLFQTKGESDNEKVTLHFGCQEHPTICQNITVDLGNYEITFEVIQKRLTTTSITFSLIQMNEAIKFILTAMEGINRVQKAS